MATVGDSTSLDDRVRVKSRAGFLRTDILVENVTNKDLREAHLHGRDSKFKGPETEKARCVPWTERKPV